MDVEKRALFVLLARRMREITAIVRKFKRFPFLDEDEVYKKIILDLIIGEGFIIDKCKASIEEDIGLDKFDLEETEDGEEEHTEL